MAIKIENVPVRDELVFDEIREAIVKLQPGQSFVIGPEHARFARNVWMHNHAGKKFSGRAESIDTYRVGRIA